MSSKLAPNPFLAFSSARTTGQFIPVVVISFFSTYIFSLLSTENPITEKSCSAKFFCRPTRMGISLRQGGTKWQKNSPVILFPWNHHCQSSFRPILTEGRNRASIHSPPHSPKRSCCLLQRKTNSQMMSPSNYFSLWPPFSILMDNILFLLWLVVRWTVKRQYS